MFVSTVKAYLHGSGTTRFRIFVMPGLVPGIHAFVAPAFAVSAGMPTDQVRGLKAHGSSPAMTTIC
jgi:hypothetical protein